MIRPLVLLIACAAVLSTVAVPAGATHNNAGTVKVHDDESENPATRNVPHVDCEFWIEGFGVSDDSGTIVFFSWPPTGDKTVVLPEGEGSLSWEADEGNVSGEFHFLAGPFELPTGHYRVEVYTDDGHPGSDAHHFAKSKTFWVECEEVPVVNPPCPPNVLAAALTGAQVRLTWGNVTDADAYLVYRATGEADFELLAQVDAEDLTSMDGDVEAGVTYSYYVTAVIGDVESENCQHVSVTAIPFFPGLAVGALALIGSVAAFVVLRRRS